jgi:4-aminobutyrate aminotransferase/(S)-3-amino-2-methylpropionate transaminase
MENGNDPPRIRVRPPGPVSHEWIERLARVESPAVEAREQARSDVSGVDEAPIVYASGIGSNVTDVDGNRYVDLAAGFGSMLLGHGSRQVARSLATQSDRLMLALGDACPSDAKIALVEKMAALYPEPGARVLLGQSGSDAVTAALKTAKLATGRPGVVAFVGSYHGLGYGPLAACGLRASWREAFADQLNSHVAFVPYPGKAAELDRSLVKVKFLLAKGDVGAVLVEPILGRGGCVVPPDGFLARLLGQAHEAGALLVADEIWTGLGRSGHWLASVAAGAVPDVVCLGKGLGGGLPLSACVGSQDVMRSWSRDDRSEVIHTATFNGAPLACATAMATIDVLERQKLPDRSAAVGRKLLGRLAAALAGVPACKEVRGAGLMIGIELGGAKAALSVRRDLLAAGYIVTLGGLRGEVLIATPPLNIAEALLDGFVSATRAAASTLPAIGASE